MFCGSLDGRGVWGRMDTCISVAESLHCPPEIVTTLFSGYTPIQNKKLKKTNKQVWRLGTTVYRQFINMSVLLTLVLKPSWKSGAE